jgi:hypothetical protein
MAFWDVTDSALALIGSDRAVKFGTTIVGIDCFVSEISDSHRRGGVASGGW